MRNDFRQIAPQGGVQQIEAEAWVVLEMHFLSRPYLFTEARARLSECLAVLSDEGMSDPRELKDRACREVQMIYGPAPALNDDTLPARTYVA